MPAMNLNDKIITDTIEADEEYIYVNLEGRKGVACTISGTWVATLVPEISINDRTSWLQASFINATTFATSTSTTANGSFFIGPLYGVASVRVRADAFTSGTVNVVLRATEASEIPLSLISGAGAIQVQGNAAHDAADVGYPVKIGGKAETTGPAAVSDGDRVDAWFDEYGRLVIIPQAADGSNLYQIDDTDKLAVSLYGKSSAAGDTAIEASAANAARTTGTVVVPTQTIDAYGNVLGMTAANFARSTGTLVLPTQNVDDSGNVGIDVLSIIPGTSATNLGKAVDSASGLTDTGTAILVVRDDALGALTPIEGDYVSLRVDSNGALWTHDDALDAALSGSEIQVDVVASLPAGTNAIGKLATNSGVDIGDVDILSIAAGDTNIGNVDIVTLPAGNLGQQAMAASLSIVPANNITDATYIGDIKFGEALPTGTNEIGLVGPDDYAVDDSAMPATPKTFPVSAEYRSAATTYADGDVTVLQSDVNGNLKSTLATLIAGEDLTNNKLVVEHNYSYSRKTTDGSVKASAGFIHTVSIAPTVAVPTAGLLTIYDNTAGSGTIVFSEWVFATTPGHTILLDVGCSTGIWVEYDGSLTDVSCTVSYR